jgi:hypothetical protein
MLNFPFPQGRSPIPVIGGCFSGSALTGRPHLHRETAGCPLANCNTPKRFMG